MKKILIKTFNILPRGYLKNKIRCYGFNLFNSLADFKSYYKNNHFSFKFKNGIIVKSYYEMCGDLKTPAKGYLKYYMPKEGDTIVDCGAYGGAFSLYAAKLVGDNGKVVAFEPDKENYKLLLRNIELNNLKNVIALNKGVWSKNTILPFDNIHAGTSSFFSDGRKGSFIDTEVVTLDKELERIGIRKVDFIKMDVEGAEIEAIKGAEKILKNNNVNLAIASYHILNGEKTCFEVEKLLLAFGYKVETSFSQHLTTYGTK